MAKRLQVDATEDDLEIRLLESRSSTSSLPIPQVAYHQGRKGREPDGAVYGNK